MKERAVNRVVCTGCAQACGVGQLSLKVYLARDMFERTTISWLDAVVFVRD
jgi:hypothetical protein